MFCIIIICDISSIKINFFSKDSNSLVLRLMQFPVDWLPSSGHLRFFIETRGQIKVHGNLLDFLILFKHMQSISPVYLQKHWLGPSGTVLYSNCTYSIKVCLLCVSFRETGLSGEGARLWETPDSLLLDFILLRCILYWLISWTYRNSVNKIKGKKCF